MNQNPNKKTVAELQADPAVGINNMFLNTLQEFRNGESIAELSENLQSLVAAVRETGKKGTLTYTVKISPQGDAVVLTDDIKLKAPELPRDASIFFATEEGVLQRDNPNQRKLDLREVERPKVQEVREVTAAAPVAVAAAS